MLKKSDVVQASIGKNGDFVVGEAVFIRTVTFHWIGRITKITKGFLHMEECAYIAEGGRWMQCINDGELKEVEPVKCMVRVAIGSIVDISVWAHPMPQKQI